MEDLTSQERIFRTIRLEEADRVPVTLYGINPHLRDWRSQDPSYGNLLKWAQKLQDTFAMTPVGDPNFTYFLEATKDVQDPYIYRGIGDLGTFFSFSKEIETCLTKRRVGKSVFFEQVVETPKGPLRAVYRVDDGVASTWQIEPFVKTIRDVDKILSLPYEPVEPDLSQFFVAQKALGDRAVMLLSMGDPVGVVVPLFKYERFLFYALTKKAKILELLDAMHERLFDLCRRVAERVKETVFRMWGPEYVTPPAMSPRYFEEFVVRYDQKLIELVQTKGNFACIHCHGGLKTIIDKITEMKPDMLEPIEPPPYGDMTLPELKKKVGDETCLMGYIELEDLETCTPEEVNKKVKEAIEQGAPGGGYILLPSATPFKSPLPKKTKENLIQFLKAGRKYGEYPKR